MTPNLTPETLRQASHHYPDLYAPGQMRAHADAWAAQIAQKNAELAVTNMRLEAAQRHYEAHEPCGNECTCTEFVLAWEAALAAGEEKP